MDLHRRRSVIVRMTESGQQLECVRILNDAEMLGRVLSRSGAEPEVVLEATYGWYWAADALAEAGAHVHLAHPLGISMFTHRRVKTDERDAADLADLLRMGRLPEAWIAPPEIRELRELVRHRAKLVAVRSSLKCQVHAILAGAGIAVPMTDLFGLEGQQLLEQVDLPVAGRARVISYRHLIDTLNYEIDHFHRMARGRLTGDPRYAAVQTVPGVGPVLAAVFLAEIGDVRRFARADRLTSWAGLTPLHRESDTTVHRGRITKQGSRLVRWAAVEAVQILPKTSYCGAVRTRVGERRGRNIGVVAAARELLECVYYAMRDGHVRKLDARRPATPQPTLLPS
jgi:transposase